MSEAPVTYRAADGVGWITLNRPAVLNALNTELAAALADHAETAAADAGVCVVIVRGAGRAFCSGMDRTALAGGAIGEAFYRHWNRALDRLEDMPKVSVAVLHGYSIGGGLQLASACDLRIASEDAVLGLGATRHGLIPDGSVLRLARIVGLGRAKELTLLNDDVTPAEARAMGLVNRVVPDEKLLDETRDYVQMLLKRAPQSLGLAKKILNMVANVDQTTAILMEGLAQSILLRTEDHQEGLRAFRDKRKPQFSGK